MILLLTLFASIQSIPPNGYPPDIDCQTYKDGSIMAMSECFTMQSDVWERRLHDEYSAVIKRGELDVDKLEQAQRAWVRYREANCESYSTVNGSISTVLTGRCWRDMTRDRALELHDMNWIG